MGKPLYGDVFGTNAIDFQVRSDTAHWSDGHTSHLLYTEFMEDANYSSNNSIENVKKYTVSIFFDRV